MTLARELISAPSASSLSTEISEMMASTGKASHSYIFAPKL